VGVIPGMEAVNWAHYLVQIVYWLGWVLLAVALIVGMFAVYYWMSFPFKIQYWPLYGSGKDGQFAFDKPRKNRARKSKDETSWILMWPLVKTKEIEPFDSEYIYPGKNCYAFDLNGTLIPGRININYKEDEIRSEVNPVPHYVRNWQSLQHKKNVAEFSEPSWWDDNKAMVYGVITAGLCLAMCGLTVYLTYKFAAPGIQSMDRLANAIQGFGQITGG